MPPTAIKINFAFDTMCEKKSWKKWTSMYCFAHEAYSTVIHRWTQQCINWLENWWLSGSEICLVAIPYMFAPFSHTFLHVKSIVCPVSLAISHIFCSASPCFLSYISAICTFFAYVFIENCPGLDPSIFLFFPTSYQSSDAELWYTFEFSMELSSKL